MVNDRGHFHSGILKGLKPRLEQAALYCTLASAVAVLLSIAASHILLALGFAALLGSGAKLRLPPVKLPLGLFLGGTLLALILSPDPASGRPQIRKFFVFLVLVLFSSLLRELPKARLLVLAWAGAATLASIRALVQFSSKLDESRALGRDFYQYYVGERITGFMSHWMTFGGQMMIVLLMLAAFLFFSPAGRRWRWPGIAAGAVIGAALVLGFTRSIWMAGAAGGIYLVWYWRKWVALAAPAALGLAIWLGPNSVRERFTSILRPRGELDSNLHRVVTWRTGIRMIQAHPWFGLGPEQVNRRFREFVPEDAPKPLPAGWYGHLHNIYLHYAAERGIPTLLALLWLLGKVLWDFLRALGRAGPGPGDEQFLLRGAVAVVAAVLIEGFFELNLGDSEVLALFLAVVSLGYLAVDRIGEREAPSGGIAGG